MFTCSFSEVKKTKKIGLRPWIKLSVNSEDDSFEVVGRGSSEQIESVEGTVRRVLKANGSFRDSKGASGEDDVDASREVSRERREGIVYLRVSTCDGHMQGLLHGTVIVWVSGVLYTCSTVQYVSIVLWVVV